MIDLLTSLQTYFASQTSLTSTLKKLYLSGRPDAQTITAGNPVCVLVYVSGTPEHQTQGVSGFGGPLTHHVQFSVFATTALEALNGVTAIKTAFSHAALPVTTTSYLSTRLSGQQIIQQDNKVYHAWCEFDITTAEAI
jgi:hypothetical protein